MDTAYDIGNMRDNPVALYDLCIFIMECEDRFVWDVDSECYKAFHAVVNSLWSALPPVITIDLRDPDTISQA